MILACLYLLDIFSLGAAATDTTCDNAYVVNTVRFRRKDGVGIGDHDDTMSYAGCKKGCYWNNYTTYNEFGSLKCLKCSEIKDETVCKNNIATCQWTKKGKCASQSCPNIAKVHVSLNNTAGYFVENGTGVGTRVENYRRAVKQAEECVTGSPKEQQFNQAFLDDYKAWVNHGMCAGGGGSCIGIGDGTGPTGTLGSCTSWIDNCDLCTYSPINNSNCYAGRCGKNVTLENHLTSSVLCDDKLYGVTQCTELPSMTRDKCKWDAEHLAKYTIYGATTAICRPGTFMEACLINRSYTHDLGHPCVNNLGVAIVCPGSTTGETNPVLTDDNRQKLYGYRTTQEICQNQLSQQLKACDDAYEDAVGTNPPAFPKPAGCYYEVEDYAVTPDSKRHSRIETMAQRQACHQIYQCLYVESDGRCSAWAVWAFILALVLSIVFVLVVIAVVIIVLCLKLKGSKSKTNQVSPSDDTDNLLLAEKSQAAGAGAASSSSSSADPAGPYVLIKLGKQEKQTKKDAKLAWGETVVFSNLGAEDDDVEITLLEDNGTPVGTGSLRVTTFVGKKGRVSVAVSEGGMETGSVELEVEVVVKDDQQPPLITATFVVSAGSKK